MSSCIFSQYRGKAKSMITVKFYITENLKTGISLQP